MVVRKAFSPKLKLPAQIILRTDFEAAHPTNKSSMAFLSTILVLSVDFQKCVVFSTDIPHNPKVVFKIGLFLTTLDDISAKRTM